MWHFQTRYTSFGMTPTQAIEGPFSMVRPIHPVISLAYTAESGLGRPAL